MTYFYHNIHYYKSILTLARLGCLWCNAQKCYIPYWCCGAHAACAANILVCMHGIYLSHQIPALIMVINLMYNNVRVNSNCDHPPPRANPREFDLKKKYGQISDGAGETHCQIPNGAGKNIVKCPYLPRIRFPYINCT